MATLAISSGCFGFSNRLAANVAEMATRELGVPVGVEIVVPRWGIPSTIRKKAVSAHYPLQLECADKPREWMYWALLHGGAWVNPTHNTGLPIILHAPMVGLISGELGRDGFYEKFSGREIWIENAESHDPYADPLGDIIGAAENMTELDTPPSGVCYDIGHAAAHAKISRWQHQGSFATEVLSPDLSRLSTLHIKAAHLHELNVSGDHRPLECGELCVEAVVEKLIAHSPGIQLTLEANYAGGYHEMVAMRAFGTGFLQARRAAIRDLELLYGMGQFN